MVVFKFNLISSPDKNHHYFLKPLLNRNRQDLFPNPKDLISSLRHPELLPRPPFIRLPKPFMAYDPFVVNVCQTFRGFICFAGIIICSDIIGEMGIACPEAGQIAVSLQNIVHSLCVAGMPVIFFNKMSVSQNIISVFSAYFMSVEKSDWGFWMWNDNYPPPLLFR